MMDDLDLGYGVRLPVRALEIRYSRSGGPGGQNVNKVETKATVRLDLVRSPALPEWVRPRLLEVLANRLTKDGVLIVASERHRERGQNLHAAIERMAELLRAALIPKKARKATKPTRGSQTRRVEAKRRRSGAKKTRGGGGGPRLRGPDDLDYDPFE